MSTTFEYDLKPREVFGKIDGRQHVLVEASEDAMSRYDDARVECAQIGPDGSLGTSVKGLAKVRAILVAGCLFRVLEDGTREPVSLETVRAMRHEVVDGLFELAKEISGLNKNKVKDGQPDPKGSASSSATEDTSASPTP